MNCPSCGAPLRLTENEESFRCEYCGGVYRPEENDDGVRVLGETSPMACPACAVPMFQAALSGHRITYCQQCRGMLVPMSDFLDIVEELHTQHPGHGRVQPPPDRKELDRRFACPNCHRPMDTHFYEGPGNIIIEDCSACGLNWLDAGELLRVVRAPG